MAVGYYGFRQKKKESAPLILRRTKSFQIIWEKSAAIFFVLELKRVKHTLKGSFYMALDGFEDGEDRQTCQEL